jgi:hypothetical protein
LHASSQEFAESDIQKEIVKSMEENGFTQFRGRLVVFQPGDSPFTDATIGDGFTKNSVGRRILSLIGFARAPDYSAIVGDVGHVKGRAYPMTCFMELGEKIVVFGAIMGYLARGGYKAKALLGFSGYLRDIGGFVHCSRSVSKNHSTIWIAFCPIFP